MQCCHPLEVAHIVSDYSFKTDTIITAILHNTLEDTKLTKERIVKVFGNKSYISKELFHQLFSNSLRLFTNLRKDMKTYLLDIDDKRLLNKRSLIESVFNVLKNMCI
ncbi:transposase DDE domain protein [Orientia tsutsugamushi str. UT144]|uniref:Transposase DDE domain protein n=1 Tax=Orientia tsutsugamushi str. UT144 TaxID=1441384 RepID=A0A0F3RM19_ORITS|nr:transposase DDE domain protein [Orientia tsutsugamushi str. UT144]